VETISAQQGGDSDVAGSHFRARAMVFSGSEETFISKRLFKLSCLRKIDILIGADLLPSILLSGTRPNICGSLLVQETIFGWILTGPVPASRQNQISVFSTRIFHAFDTSLDKLLTKFSEVDEPEKWQKHPI